MPSDHKIEKKSDYIAGLYWSFTLAQAPCETGGLADGEPPTEEVLAAAEKRWALRSYRPEVVDSEGWVEHQCGGCSFFAALGLDYGICFNEKSPADGTIVFEHGGCLEHSERKSNEQPQPDLPVPE